jgi:dienelactone hydrolase
VTDLRALVRYLRASGAPAVGVMGMSLGGYSSALLATVERLDFVVPFIPLASIADFARDGGRLLGTPAQQAEQHRLLERVHAVVSPLARPPRVPPAGRLVIAGEVDRITPPRHAERIAEHFEAPLETFGGAHLLQVGRETAFRRVARMLGGLGLLS